LLTVLNLWSDSEPISTLPVSIVLDFLLEALLLSVDLNSSDKDTHPRVVNALSNLRPLWATTREINGVIYEGNQNRKNNY
jgi:hypothetical protein